MSNLRLVRRAKDELPDRWDTTGERRIEWTDWRPGLRMFICPPPDPPETCEGCNQICDEHTSTGWVHPLPGETVDDERKVQSKRQPERTWIKNVRRPAKPHVRFKAFRCAGCDHVQIFDSHTKELWNWWPDA